MIALSDRSGCITPQQPSHQLDQDYDIDGGTSLEEKSQTPTTESDSYHTATCASSSQSHAHPDCDESEATDFEISVGSVEEVVVRKPRDLTPERRPRSSDGLDHDGYNKHQKNGEVLQNVAITRPITATSPQEENIEALVIQLPKATPLGMDIDMVLPIVSYIQPHSPLRQHVAIGDILIHVNGSSVMELTHVELCSILNGGASKKMMNRSTEGGEKQREEWAKLVFFPRRKYRKKLQQRELQQSEQTIIEQSMKRQESHNVQQQKCVDDDVKSCSSVHDEINVEEEESVHDGVDEATMMKEQAGDNTIASSLVDQTHTEDLDSAGKSLPSSSEEVQPQHDQEAEEHGSSDSITPNTPSSKQVIINDDNDLLTPKHHSIYKKSTSNSSPITAATRTTSSQSTNSGESRDNSYIGEILATIVTSTSSKEGDDDVATSSCRGIPFLDYLERKVKETNDKSQTFSENDCNVQVVQISVSESNVNASPPKEKWQDEKYQSIAVVGEVLPHPQAGTHTNEPGVMTKATHIMCHSIIESTAEDQECAKEHAPNHCIEEEQEGNIPEQFKGDEHVTNADEEDNIDIEEEQQQSETNQDEELDDRDRRRRERKNRAQPQIDFLSISNELDSEEDVSTLFGGVWSSQLHYAVHRVEDNVINDMEKGAGHDTVPNGYSQQRLVRGVNSPTSSKEGDDDVATSSCRGIPFLDYLERKVKETNDKSQTFSENDCNVQVVQISVSESNVNASPPKEKWQDEKYQSIAVVGEVLPHPQAGTHTNEPGVMTKATHIMCHSIIESTAEDQECAKEHAPNHCIEEEQEGNIPEQFKGDEHVTNADEEDNIDIEEEQQQSETNQDEELDDRDRRRRERKNRAQPQIDFLSISNELDSEEDVSTLFGGVWSSQLHYAVHRVEDNVINDMEKGAGHDTVPNGYSQQRLVRGVNSPAYHAAKKMKDKNSSSFIKAQRQQLMIERALIALCILAIVGLIVFLVKVLR